MDARSVPPGIRHRAAPHSTINRLALGDVLSSSPPVGAALRGQICLMEEISPKARTPPITHPAFPSFHIAGLLPLQLFPSTTPSPAPAQHPPFMFFDRRQFYTSHYFRPKPGDYFSRRLPLSSAFISVFRVMLDVSVTPDSIVHLMHFALVFRSGNGLAVCGGGARAFINYRQWFCNYYRRREAKTKARGLRVCMEKWHLCCPRCNAHKSERRPLPRPAATLGKLQQFSQH